MKLSRRGYLELLSHESICLSPYLDGGDVWTIGAGITKSDGIKISKNTTPLPDVKAAIEQYKQKIEPYIKAVNEAVCVSLTQNQFDALVSFHYNTGAINNPKTTLTKIVNQDPNALARIDLEFMKWVYDNGKVVKGLINRRKKEKSLYIYGTYTNTNEEVLVFPVDKNYKPVYNKGIMKQVRHYFDN